MFFTFLKLAFLAKNDGILNFKKRFLQDRLIRRSSIEWALNQKNLRDWVFLKNRKAIAFGVFHFFETSVFWQKMMEILNLRMRFLQGRLIRRFSIEWALNQKNLRSISIFCTLSLLHYIFWFLFRQLPLISLNAYWCDSLRTRNIQVLN